VDAAPLGFDFGGHKPPAGYQRYDLHIRNPSTKPLWLVIDAYGAFPDSISSVRLERNLAKRDQATESIFLWSVSGSSSALQAFYVAPFSDVTLHEVEIETTGPPATIPIRFVDRLELGGRWAQDWLGHDRTLPLRGEVTLERQWEPVIRREQHSKAVIVDVHVLCVQLIATSRSAATGR
jgi:hypothetical protein